MTILITGAAGFIGSQLAIALKARGDTVYLIDNLSFGHLDNLIFNGRPLDNFLCRDVRDVNLINSLKDKKIDTVIHLAGISSLPECQIKPYEAYDVNVSGTANILEISRKIGIKRFIFASTSAVYENSKSKKFKESEVVTPDLTYASTKLAAEKICQSYANNYDLDIIICRFFNIYGPHQDVKRKSPPFTSYLARELVNNNAPTIFNNTNFKRDYVYVDDLIDLITLMINSPKHFGAEIFNIGSGVGISAKDIFSLFLKVSNKKIKAKFKDPMGYWDNYSELFEGKFTMSRKRIVKEVHKHSIADITKTSKNFRWKPQVLLNQGISNVYEYTKLLLK